jgi:EmrB/QacA subfamily drug resistance transporter
LNSSNTAAPSWRVVALLVAGVLFMEVMDGTIIVTALPHMAVSFHVGVVDLNVGITAYLMAMAVFIPISGWIADRFGARTVFTVAVVLFTLASVWCAASTTLTSFILARVLQGIGGALSLPVGRLIVLRVTQKRDLLLAIAYLTWPALAAPVLAPPLGGFIVEHASWRWIFLINLPLGAVAVALSLWLIPNERPSSRPALDVLGFVLTALACAILMYTLESAGNGTASTLMIFSGCAAGLSCGYAAVRHLRRAARPLIDLSTMRIHTFAITIGWGSLTRMAVSAAPFLLVLMFQVGFGLDAFTSGLLVLALFAGNLVMKSATTRVLRQFGFRRVLVVNGVVTALTLAACALLNPGTSFAVIAALLFISGLSRSMQFTALASLGFADVPQTQMSAANTLSSTLAQLNLAMGVAFAAFALRLPALVNGDRANVLVEFHFAFLLIALVSLVAVLGYSRLPADAGAEVSHHRRGGVSVAD